MRIFLGLIAAVLLVFALKFGSVTPCGILRSQVREAAARAGGMEALVGALPDSMIDGLIAVQYGPLTQGRCIGLLLQRPSPQTSQVAPLAQPALRTQSNSNSQNNFMATRVSPTLHRAAAEVVAVQRECQGKRVSGMLPSFKASAECSNPGILDAYRKISYPYMDLIIQWTAKRSEVAEKLDSHALTEAQGRLEMTQFMSGLGDEARARDRGER